MTPTDQLSARSLDRLRWAYATAVLFAVGLLFVASMLATDDDVGGHLEPWLAGIVVAAVGVPVLFVVRYYLRRPLERHGLRDYAVTVLFRAATALAPAVAGFVVFVASGPLWLALAGTGFALVALAWTVPSQADYARHRGLATDVAPHPPDEVWGNVPEGYVAPWEDPEGGHGHGLHDHH